MDPEDIRKAAGKLAPIAALYTYRLKEFGATARGVFWRNDDGQRLRFEVLLGVIDVADDKGGISIADLGCGYGALFDFIAGRPFMQGSRYYGYDICEDMVREAGRRIKDPRARFDQSLMAMQPADYSFVSGTYNMKLDDSDREWAAYVEANLRDLWAKTRKGLAFNMLCAATKGRKEHDLYYADWRVFRDFCAKELSPNVTVLRDYPLAEWTIYVHRQG